MIWNLLWKEWRENKIYFFSLLAWMVVGTLYVVAYELFHSYRASIGSFASLATLCGSIGAIILATRVAQGERAAGTMAYTYSLPVPQRTSAAVRILFSTAILAIPIAIGGGILAIALKTGIVEQVVPREQYATTDSLGDFRSLAEMESVALQEPYPASVSFADRRTGSISSTLDQLASVTVIAITNGTTLLLILSLCGTFLRSQSQVGVVGVVIALGSALLVDTLRLDPLWDSFLLFVGLFSPNALMFIAATQDKMGSYSDVDLAQNRWLPMCMGLLFQFVLAGWFVSRYSTLNQIKRKPRPRISISRFGDSAVFRKLPIPLSTRWIAMVWLELRQAVPLAFIGLSVAMLLATILPLISDEWDENFTVCVRDTFAHTTFFVGLFCAVIVGSHQYASDTGPGVGSFRRSRPIPHEMWFWIKYFSGLLALLLVLDCVTILLCWNLGGGEVGYAYVACIPLYHAFCYSISVFWTCLIRQPLLASIVAFLSVGLISEALTFFPVVSSLELFQMHARLHRDEMEGRLDFVQSGYFLTLGFKVVAIGILALASLRFAKPLEPFIRVGFYGQKV